MIKVDIRSKNWRSYGPIIDIKAKNFDRIIKWGRRKHGDPTED